MANADPVDISIGGDTIRLGQFLKFAGILDSGGDVKEAIIDGLVTVNGEIDRRRGRQLSLGDVVEFDGRAVRVRPLARPRSYGSDNSLTSSPRASSICSVPRYAECFATVHWYPGAVSVAPRSTGFPALS